MTKVEEQLMHFMSTRKHRLSKALSRHRLRQHTPHPRLKANTMDAELKDAIAATQETFVDRAAPWKDWQSASYMKQIS